MTANRRYFFLLKLSDDRGHDIFEHAAAVEDKKCSADKNNEYNDSDSRCYLRRGEHHYRREDYLPPRHLSLVSGELVICAVYDHAAVIHLIFAARHDLSKHAREQHNNEQKCRYAEHGLFVDLYSGAFLFRLHGGFGGRRLLLFHFRPPCLTVWSFRPGIVALYSSDAYLSSIFAYLCKRIFFASTVFFCNFFQINQKLFFVLFLYSPSVSDNI